MPSLLLTCITVYHVEGSKKIFALGLKGIHSGMDP